MSHPLNFGAKNHTPVWDVGGWLFHTFLRDMGGLSLKYNWEVGGRIEMVTGGGKLG